MWLRHETGFDRPSFKGMDCREWLQLAFELAAGVSILTASDYL